MRMILAPPGIVVGPGRIRLWWTRVLDWLERRYAPRLLTSRQDLPHKQEEITRLEQLVDKLWP